MVAEGGPMTRSETVADRSMFDSSGDSTGIRQTDDSIFVDDFEDYSTGTVPSYFVLAGNTDQEVVSESSPSGSQAYRMSGSHGACWRALARAPVETADAMTVRGSFKRGDGSVGCHEDQSGGIRFRTVASSSWSEGSAAGLLRFRPDGTVASNGEVVGEYTPGEWTEFTVTYRRADGKVTHECVIDGNSSVTVTRDVVDHEDDLSALELKSDDFTVYWDDLSVTADDSEESDGTPVDPPSDDPEPPDDDPDPSVPDLDFAAGEYEEVTVNDARYYVIRNVPETESGQFAVTTPEFDLVSPTEAVDAFLTHLASRTTPRLDWDRRRSEAESRRENMRGLELLNRFLEITTGVLETYALFKVSPPSAIGAGADLLRDSISWSISESERPYERAFGMMTASCATAETIETQLDAVESIEDFGDQETELVSTAVTGYGVVEAGADFADGYATMADRLATSPNFTQTAAVGVSATETFLLAETIDLAASQLDAVFDLRARIAALFHAYDTVRLPLIDRIQAKTVLAEDWALTPGDMVQYHSLMASYNHMGAMAYLGAAEYYDRMSDLRSGRIWDVIDGASDLADDYATIGDTLYSAAKEHYLAIGGAWRDVERQTVSSVNAEAYDLDPAELTGFSGGVSE